MAFERKIKRKKQHYVPKFYLRNFSSDRYNVNIFHLKTGKILFSPIASTCQESNFYGRDGEFENLLNMIDNNHAKTIKGLIESKSIPLPASKDHITLLEFLLVLHTRTSLEREIVKNYGDAFCDKYIKPTMRFLLKEQGMEEEIIAGYSVKIKNMDIFHKQSILNAMDSIIGIRDLVPCLVGNNSDIPFISSDNPVIFNNRIHLDNNFTAILSRGLQIHCPLSPNLYLILYDPAFYSIDQSISPSLRDIDRLNALQLLHCNEILVTPIDTTKEYLDKLCQNYIKMKCIKNTVIKTKKSEWLNNRTRSDIDEVTLENANHHMNFGFLKFNHQSYRTFKEEYIRVKKERINAVFPRDLETVKELSRFKEMMHKELMQYENDKE